MPIDYTAIKPGSPVIYTDPEGNKHNALVTLCEGRAPYIVDLIYIKGYSPNMPIRVPHVSDSDAKVNCWDVPQPVMVFSDW